MVKLADAEPVILAGTAEHEYKITARDLHNTLNENTRLIILNSPSNPTGEVYTEKEDRDLVEVLIEHPKVVLRREHGQPQKKRYSGSGML